MVDSDEDLPPYIGERYRDIAHDLSRNGYESISLSKPSGRKRLQFTHRTEFQVLQVGKRTERNPNS